MAEVAISKDNRPQEDASPVKPRRRGLRKVTPKNIDKVQQDLFCQNAVPMLEALYPSLIEMAKNRNMKALEIIAQMTNLIKAPGGVNILNQIYNRNQNVVSAPSEDGPSSIQSFEGILRRLESTDSPRNAMVDNAPQ